jgi:hypothetical protein
MRIHSYTPLPPEVRAQRIAELIPREWKSRFGSGTVAPAQSAG